MFARWRDLLPTDNKNNSPCSALSISQDQPYSKCVSDNLIWFIAGREKGTVRVWNREHCRSNHAIGLHEMKYGSTPERDFNYFSPSDPVAPYLFSHPIWYRGAWAKAIRSLMIAKHEPAPAEEFSAGHARKSFPSRLQCASAAGGSSQCRKAADFRAAKTDSCARVVFPWVCACAL